MFRMKLTVAGLVVAAAFLGSSSGRALAAHDSWYGYATSLTQTQTTPSQPFITDTLAPGGGPSVVPVPVSRGFEWGASGIGALVMGGVGVLLLAGRRTLQRRRIVAV
jgi:hypothetical protein